MSRRARATRAPRRGRRGALVAARDARVRERPPGPGAARKASSASKLRAVEDSGRLGDALDLVEEPVAFDAVGGVLQRVLGEHDHEAGCDPGSFAAQDAAHPLDHLAPGPARAHDDPEVRVGYVDAFVEHARSRDGVESADAEIVEDLPALTPSRRTGDQIDRHQRIEPVDGVVRGAHGLGEHQRAVGFPDGRRKTAEQLVLADSSAPRSGGAWRTRRDTRGRRGRRRRHRARRGARPRRGSRRTARAACRCTRRR